MRTKRTVTIVIGLALMFASSVGHFWHKYFTATGTSRAADFQEYASHHWYYWLAFSLGLLLVVAGILRHPRSLHSTPR